MAMPQTVAEAAQLLGVAVDADAALVAQRFRALAQIYHADRGGHDPAAEQRMRKLNAAKELLDAREPSLIVTPRTIDFGSVHVGWLEGSGRWVFSASTLKLTAPTTPSVCS